MKKLSFLFAVVLTATLFFSCDENLAIVPESVVVDTERKVMIEEFTGVACVGCPAGSRELESLLDQFGENLVVVSIHTSDFGTPFATSNHDFRTQEAEEIADYLGRPAQYPSAVVNRKDFDGGVYILQSPKELWAGRIVEELEEAPKLTVNITKDFDPTTRKLDVRVSGRAEEDITGDLRLTIMVAENNIIDPQDDEVNGFTQDYNHKHVFRTTMTEPTGDPLVSNMSQGDSYDRSYSLTLDDGWKIKDCEVIAFVNLINGQEKEILQVDASKVED